MKFWKPYTGIVAAIFCVLVIQALCDLSLPSYTSDIVNIGIQQGGIKETAPEVMRKEEFERLLLFVPSAKSQEVEGSYRREKGGLYRLKEEVKSNKKEYNGLSRTLVKPILLAEGVQSKKASLTETLRGLSEKERDQAVERLGEKLKEVPDTIAAQAAALFAKKAYEKAGIDTRSMQNRYILKTGAKMLFVAACAALASVLVGLMASRVGAFVGRDLRGKIFKKVTSFSSTEFDKYSTASLITRSTNDVWQIQTLTVMLLRMVLYSPIIAAGGVWKVFHTNVKMSWIIGLAVLLIVLVVLVLFFVVMPKFKILQKLLDKLNLLARELLTGLSVIRAFGTEKYEEDRFDKANKELTRTNLFVNRAMTFMMPLMMLIMNGISVLIIWFGAKGVNNGAMQVGDMMAFIQYAMQIIMSFFVICMISVMLPRAAVSAERVDEILNAASSVLEAEKPEHISREAKGELTFEGVSFRYSEAEEDVLHDLNFTVRCAQTTAIIGSTGSGKSTLVNLIPRFYDVTRGRILLDGKDIRSLPLHELRGTLGYVPQKAVLFSGSIASNIMYGNPKGGKEEMKRAAKTAQALEFIKRKEKGYKSSISQGGVNVSGGQKQRLSIARAVAVNPKIYIFDDSFSALDYKTDAALRRALKKEMGDSAVIIVAQRISTILNADQIIVLDEGRIVGIGTHRELLRECAIYYQIAASQLSEDELDKYKKEAV